MKPVGLEYTVVGWSRHRWVLSNQSLLCDLLETICSAVSMRSLGSIGVDVDLELSKLQVEQFEDEGGSSASLVLSTSHVNIHGWPRRDDNRSDGGFFWFTIGSCRPFDTSIVDSILNDSLGVTEVKRFKREILI